MKPRLFPVLLLCTAGPLAAADQPQWGQAWNRNMVAAERGLPESFDPASGRHVKWAVPLGSESHGTPIVAGGRVYIGTNNEEPRDPEMKGDRGVLLCLDERDGSLLWQLAVPKRSEDQYFDWPRSGICSPVTVEGERLYVVNNRHQLLCLDVAGISNGNDGPFVDEGRLATPHQCPPPDFRPVLAERAEREPGPRDADVIWMLDLPAEAGIWPHDGAHSSVLIHGDVLYLNTGTGVDSSHRRLPKPEAPSLIAVDKASGRLLARERAGIGPRIFHCTWSAPALAEIGGRPQILFCGGDGVLRAFSPLEADPAPGDVATLEELWSLPLDPDAPQEDVHRYVQNRQEGPSNVYGMPVFAGGLIHVAGGGDIFWGKNEAWLQAIDPLTRERRWSAPLERHTLSTPAVHEGRVYIADTGRMVRCVEAASGRELWSHESDGEFWASPLVADGRVYIGSRKGRFHIFADAAEKRVLSEVDLGSPISGTATAANGVLYVATQRQLLALAVER